MIKSEFKKKKSRRTLFINTTDWTGAMTCFHNSPAVGFFVTSLQQVSGAKGGNFWCQICFTHFVFSPAVCCFSPENSNCPSLLSFAPLTRICVCINSINHLIGTSQGVSQSKGGHALPALASAVKPPRFCCSPLPPSKRVKSNEASPLARG